MRSKGIHLLSLFVVVVLTILGVVLLVKNQDIKDLPREKLLDNISNDSPKAFPFSEMTIPYLRDREYVSSLGTLNNLSSGASYTSYLTNYDSDGLIINAQLTKPTGNMPQDGWPAIIFVHGYIAPSVYETLTKYTSYVDYLAKNGFVVFKIDLRGHGQSEGEASGAYYSGDYVVDTLNAKAALEASGFVKKNAIGLWGHSMAGNVVLRSFAASNGDIPAAVVWAGAVFSYEDLLKYRINDNSYRPPMDNSNRARKRRELIEKYGEFNKNSDFWKQVPATNYLKDISGAIQIHHAEDDDVVNIGYSRDLMSILDKTKIGHELFEYSSGGHNISGVNFNKAMQRTVDFFEKHLN